MACHKFGSLDLHLLSSCASYHYYYFEKNIKIVMLIFGACITCISPASENLTAPATVFYAPDVFRNCRFVSANQIVALEYDVFLSARRGSYVHGRKFAVQSHARAWFHKDVGWLVVTSNLVDGYDESATNSRM